MTTPGKEALKTQLKAMLWAYAKSRYHNIQVKFPMVKNTGDLDFLSGILKELFETPLDLDKKQEVDKKFIHPLNWELDQIVAEIEGSVRKELGLPLVKECVSITDLSAGSPIEQEIYRNRQTGICLCPKRL